MGTYLDHERLEVYQVAREPNREIRRVADQIPRGHAESRDNITRAAKSINRNVAEGSGKWQIADKVHFYQIARGSATECAASLDELVDYAGLVDDRATAAKELLARIVAMLTAMIRALASRDSMDMTR